MNRTIISTILFTLIAGCTAQGMQPVEIKKPTVAPPSLSVMAAYSAGRKAGQTLELDASTTGQDIYDAIPLLPANIKDIFLSGMLEGMATQKNLKPRHIMEIFYDIARLTTPDKKLQVKRLAEFIANAPRGTLIAEDILSFVVALDMPEAVDERAKNQARHWWGDRIISWLILSKNKWSRNQKIQFVTDIKMAPSNDRPRDIANLYKDYDLLNMPLSEGMNSGLYRLQTAFKGATILDFVPLKASSYTPQGSPIWHPLFMGTLHIGSDQSLLVALELGADINALTSRDEDENILMAFVDAIRWDYEGEGLKRRIKFLLDHGAKIAIGKESALFNAVKDSKVPAVAAMLEYGDAQLTSSIVEQLIRDSQSFDAEIMNRRQRYELDEYTAQQHLDKQAEIRRLLQAKLQQLTQQKQSSTQTMQVQPAAQ